MQNYHITTDSVVDLTPERMKELDVPFVSLHVHLDGEDFPDDMKPETTAKIFDAMHQGKVPTTSQATVEDFQNMWEPLLQAGEDILYIGLSSSISGTVNSAFVARDQLAERYSDRRIHIVDSLGGSSSQGVLLEHAVELKNSGMALDACFHAVEEMKQCVHHWFTVGDLAYLRRGGRVSGAAAVVATLLHIKPVMVVTTEGKLVPREKVKGRHASVKRLYELLCEKINLVAAKFVHITYAECLEDAKYLAKSIEERFPQLLVRMYSVGAVIGAHGGPGTLCISFLGQPRTI